MFIFQSWKNKEDYTAWNSQAAKKNDKILSTPVAWLIKEVIAPFSKSEKGMQCIAHYLNRAGSELVSESKTVKPLVNDLGKRGILVNAGTIGRISSMNDGDSIDLPSGKGTYYVNKEGSGWKLYSPAEPLRLSVSKPEWEFILKQTKVDWLKSDLKNDLLKYNSQTMREEMAKDKEMPMLLATANQNLADFRKAIKTAGFEPNLTNADVRTVLTLAEGKKICLKLGGMNLDVRMEGGKLQLYSQPIPYPATGQKFYERMKREGIDLDRMEKEMKPGEKKEFADKDGRPYLAVKEKANEDRQEEPRLWVYYNRKWLPPDKDGWERMHMVPGGIKAADMTRNDFADSWNVLGFTTVARKKSKDGGYDYKIEEKFGFAGSRSEGGIMYNRIVPNTIGKQIKKHFPSISVRPVETQDGVCEVIVNATWIGTVGKEFPLIIDGASTDRKGALHVKGEEPGYGSAFIGMR